MYKKGLEMKELMNLKFCKSSILTCLIVGLCLASVACSKPTSLSSPPSPTSDLASAYLGQEPPGMISTPFASELLLSPSGETHSVCQFSPDGTEVYWSSIESDGLTYHLYYMNLENGAWTKPAAAPFSEIGDSPTFSADGKKLYFSLMVDGKENIHVVERINGTWSTPTALPDAVNSLKVHWTMSLTSNGDLYFSGRELEKSDATINDIYCAEQVNGQFTRVTKLDELVNSPSREFCPFIKRDGSYLIFARTASFTDRPNLFVSFRSIDGSWGTPVELPSSVNTYGSELCPWVSDDDKYLFFTRNNQIYWVDAKVIESVRPK